MFEGFVFWSISLINGVSSYLEKIFHSLASRLLPVGKARRPSDIPKGEKDAIDEAVSEGHYPIKKQPLDYQRPDSGTRLPSNGSQPSTRKPDEIKGPPPSRPTESPKKIFLKG